LSLLSQGTEVVCQVIDNLTSASISSIIKVCRDKNVPFFGFVSDQSEMGAVLVVSRDYHQAGIDAVMLAKKVFDGEDISKIPFEFVSRTDILFNPDIAATFGMKASEDLLNQKGVVIIKK
jgi:putative tryptophan/tyrosine transport system substrate-binding protein